MSIPVARRSAAARGLKRMEPWRFARAAVGLAAGAHSIVKRWIARSNQRRALMDIAQSNDRHLLRDIGVSQNEAFREAEKWFWHR